jgi:hypothetical protein
VQAAALTYIIQSYCTSLQEKPDYEFDCRAERDALGHIVAVSGYSAHLLHMLMELLKFK